MMYSIYIIRYTVNPLARWGVRGDHKKNVEIHEIKVVIIINRNIFFDSFTGVWSDREPGGVHRTQGIMAGEQQHRQYTG